MLGGTLSSVGLLKLTVVGRGRLEVSWGSPMDRSGSLSEVFVVVVRSEPETLTPPTVFFLGARPRPLDEPGVLGRLPRPPTPWPLPLPSLPSPSSQEELLRLRLLLLPLVERLGSVREDRLRSEEESLPLSTSTSSRLFFMAVLALDLELALPLPLPAAARVGHSSSGFILQGNRLTLNN